jgi:cytochrome oxidase Cu insertion factor (SCO1/SenC/PrrC family)
MPGMNSGLNVHNPVIAHAFHAALIGQGIIALLILGIAVLAWAALRLRRRTARGAGEPADTGYLAEPAGRRVLRIGFGILWIFDGLLQAQSAMAIGLPSQVIEPIAAASPRWVQHLENWSATAWSYHPVQAGASAVWIQIGIGLWLLAAPRGISSRLAGLVSAGWGLVVWIFGEVFGGMLSGGQSWLFGAPGAVIFYCAGGALIALPERHWRTARLGRIIRTVVGVFFIAMSVLQAWPGRGFWQGTLAAGRPGTLAGMAEEMAQMPQPGLTSRLVDAFGTFDSAHGFAVNLFVVVALAAIGVSLIAARPGLLRLTVVFAAALCLADWVFVQDLGFLGGLGTDPNSMIPLLVLVAGGYLACTRRPAAVQGSGTEPAGRVLAWAAAARRAVATASLGSMVSLAALGVILLGAAPMAAAQASSGADPILAEAVSGPAVPQDRQAPDFALTDQAGLRRSLSSLRGDVVFLTFLDPASTSDGPLIGQELAAAARLTQASAHDIAFVAVVLSPAWRSVRFLRAFDRREGLAGLPDWTFLTGSAAELRRVWRSYGVYIAGATHNDIAYVIDRTGVIRAELSTEPGPGTAATRASFAAFFAETAEQAQNSG